MENDLDKNKNENIIQLNPVQLNSIYDKNKELLINLLKEKLDTKLCKLEKKHKNYDTIIKLTKKEVKNITDWSINASKQIKEKIKKDKEKHMLQSKQSKSRGKNATSLLSKSYYLKAKTPLRSKTTKSFITQNNKTEISRNTKTKSLFGSKTAKTLGIRAKSYTSLFKDKRKPNQNNNKNQNNLLLVGSNHLNCPSIISNKSNNKNKSKKSLIKINNKTITPVRKKTPYKRRNSHSDKTESVFSKDKENVVSSYTIKKNDQNNKTVEVLNMNKMESALQKDEGLFNNNDPLLISPITDSDFYPNGRLSLTSLTKTMNSEIKELHTTHVFTFNNMEKNIDDKIYAIISDFLSIDDLIRFKNTSKCFNKLFKTYIINNLQKDKIYFTNKKNRFDKNNIPPKLSFSDFTISKGGLKAIKLLNEPSLNHVFKDESKPVDDRLIIYRIFFQLINHPYKFIQKDRKEEFWKKCQNYFSQEINGKTGDLLQKILDEKLINIEGDNLYKIYKLAENNLHKIYPNHFSTICGTTGLFVFLIKDILDFVGISNDQKIQNKAYWTYVKIIDSIDNKINHINKLRNNKI